MKLQARHSQWISRVLVFALMAVAVPLPVFAGEAPAPTPAPTPPTPSLTAMIDRAAAVTPIAPARGQAAGAKPSRADTTSPAFFKKPVGIVILATLAAGVGYAMYSTTHDRITSPGRK